MKKLNKGVASQPKVSKILSKRTILVRILFNRVNRSKLFKAKIILSIINKKLKCKTYKQYKINKFQKKIYLVIRSKKKQMSKYTLSQKRVNNSKIKWKNSKNSLNMRCKDQIRKSV